MARIRGKAGQYPQSSRARCQPLQMRAGSIRALGAMNGNATHFQRRKRGHRSLARALVTGRKHTPSGQPTEPARGPGSLRPRQHIDAVRRSRTGEVFQALSQHSLHIIARDRAERTRQRRPVQDRGPARVAGLLVAGCGTDAMHCRLALVPMGIQGGVVPQTTRRTPITAGPFPPLWPSRHLQQRLRVLGHDREQGSGGAGGCAAPLLPILKGANRHAQ